MFGSDFLFSGQAGGFYPTTIDQSLRFNDNDSAYLSRTPASAGDTKKWTISFWVKRANLGTGQMLISAGTSSVNYINFQSDDTLKLRNSVASTEYVTTQKFRDPSAWYHIVFVWDTVQAVDVDRAKFYVNGELITSYSTYTKAGYNEISVINTATSNRFGNYAYNNTNYLDAYMAEVHFLNGIAATADDFGEFKSGVWVAKAYEGAYDSAAQITAGTTNGFYLDFANSADIGNDVSGNGNDWTPNNFTASDVVLDSPTDNFCTFNPLNKAPRHVLSNGNLEIDGSVGNQYNTSLASFSVTSGKYYWEFNVVDGDNNTVWVGVANSDSTSTSGTTLATALQVAKNWHLYGYNGTMYLNGVSDTTFTGTLTFGTGDLVMVAMDADTGKVWIGKNNSWFNSGDPSAGTGEMFTASGDMTPIWGSYKVQHNVIANFGQLGFTYTPPTGFNALSTNNLPDPVIDPAQDASPSDYFDTLLWTGDLATSREIDGLTFQPDFVWIKDRSVARDSVIFDVVRGATNYLRSASSGTEGSSSTTLQSFDSDGFTIGDNSANNANTETYVAWNWKAGGSGVTNNVGSITSTVSANTTSGFSIVSYSGNSTVGATIGHGLSQAPEFVIFKARNTALAWIIQADAIGSPDAGYYMLFTSAGRTANNTVNTTFGASTITLDSSTTYNGTGGNYIAYCFHSVDGYSKIGSYIGSSNLPFVYCGFRPRFVMVKRTITSSSGHWAIHDTARDTGNEHEDVLLASSAIAETDGYGDIDILSNGFKLRNTAGTFNTSGDTYTYMAFAENPFKYSNAR